MTMPGKQTIAHKPKRAGKAPTHRRPRVSCTVSQLLKREPRSTASCAALSRQAARAASQGTASLTAMLDDYRQNAFDCVQMARRVGDRQNKAILVLIAQAWIKLAEQDATLRNGRVAREASARNDPVPPKQKT
jgi:hypothetical protein